MGAGGAYDWLIRVKVLKSNERSLELGMFFIISRKYPISLASEWKTLNTMAFLAFHEIICIILTARKGSALCLAREEEY